MADQAPRAPQAAPATQLFLNAAYAKGWRDALVRVMRAAQDVAARKGNLDDLVATIGDFEPPTGPAAS